MRLKNLVGLKMSWSSTLEQPFDGEPEVLYPKRSHTNPVLRLNSQKLGELARAVSENKQSMEYAITIECVYTVDGERYTDADDFVFRCVYGDITPVAVDCCIELLEHCYSQGGVFERFNFYTEITGV